MVIRLPPVGASYQPTLVLGAVDTSKTCVLVCPAQMLIWSLPINTGVGGVIQLQNSMFTKAILVAAWQALLAAVTV